jgi:hypothetical protein
VNRLEGVAELCAGDGEFMLLARHWTGTLRLGIGNDCIDLRMRDGVPVAEVSATAAEPLPDEPGLIGLSATRDLWERMLAPVPEPFYNDVVPAQALGLQRSGSELTFWQYYPAVRRVVELLRPAPLSARST